MIRTTAEPRMANLDAEPRTAALSPSLDAVFFDGKQIGTIREFAGVSIAKACEPYAREAYTHGSTDRRDALGALIQNAINLSPRDFGNLPDESSVRAIL